MPKFDLEAAVAAQPPGPAPRRNLIETHPRIAEWFGKLVAMRDAGHRVDATYIARILTRGAREEGIIPKDAAISEYVVRRHLKRT